MNHFSIGLWCAAKSGLYTTTSDDQLSGWTENKSRISSKVLPKAKLTPKKGHSRCSVVVYCWSDPLQLSESWQNHYIWEVRSANDEMHQKLQCPQLVLVNTKGPILFHNIQSHVAQHFKSWANWATKFCLLHHIHLTSHQTITTSSILRTFCREKRFHNQEAQNAFHEFIESWSQDFYATGIN